MSKYSNPLPLSQLFTACALVFLAGCSPAAGLAPGMPAEEKLIIFHAGSLAVPVSLLSARFQELNPDVEILAEAAGSRTTARKVSELGREADLIMSADSQVIKTLLVPDHASWYVGFASNHMVVAYTEQSAFASQINPDNWYQILTRDGVVVGRSNPQADPNGYRTLLVWQLAEDYYGVPGLYSRLEKASPPQNIRPKETDLVPLLQSGEMDYAFSYLSVAVQSGLDYIVLPDQINLGNPDYNDLYQTAEVVLDGTEPGQVIVQKGELIIYGLTVPSLAPNPRLAEAFLVFLFSSEGRAIMQSQGLPVFEKPLCSAPDLMPPDLANLVCSGN